MDRGGVETWLIRILRKIDRDNLALDFLVDGAQPGAYDAEARALGARIIPLAMPCRKRPWKCLTYPSRLRRAFGGYGPFDVIHSHLHRFSGFVLRAAHGAGVKARVAHSHTAGWDSQSERGLLRGWQYRQCSRWLDRHATAGLACSKTSAAALFGNDWQSDPRWRVLYYGIDLSPFTAAVDAETVRSELGIRKGARVVGHVGNFSPPKNHEFLVEVIAQCRRHTRQVVFLLVGDGPLRPRIQRAVAERGLGDAVVFAGSRADVPRLLTGAVDLFVLPSLWEGFPNVTLEAQAAGLPVLVSERVTGEVAVTPSLVEQLPLEAGPEQWATRILARLDAPRPSQREALKVIHDSPFSIDRSVGALVQFYRDCVRST
jgi:glycosyltransferase involved in cell wall biosynthesis